MLEAAIWLAADYLAEELLVIYPRRLWFGEIADNLVAASEEFVESSPGLPPIRRLVVANIGLVPLLARVLLMTVARNCDDYVCWFD